MRQKQEITVLEEETEFVEQKRGTDEQLYHSLQQPNEPRGAATKRSW